MKKVIYSILSAIVLSIIFIPNVFAENLDYNITVQPSLNLTTSATDIKLSLNPATNPFSSKDLTVSVGTNNETGYKLYISSINNTTNLIEENDNNLYIETLAEEVSENEFKTNNTTANRWGYKLDSANDKYAPFPTGNILVSSSDKATNNISKTLVFAAKAGYETKPGTYNLALKFEAIANPLIKTIADAEYMQEVSSKAIGGCPADLTIGQAYDIKDSRDGQTYKVARLADGNCWLLDNLKLSSTAIGLTKDNSNVPYDNNNAWYLPSSTSTGFNSYTNKMINTDYINTKVTSWGAGSGEVGVYYNYCAATAGTYCYAENAGTGDAEYDICPKGWRMPTGGPSGEYQALYSAYNNQAAFKAALGTPLSGVYVSSAAYYQGSWGYFWSSTIEDGNIMYNLRIDSSTVYPMYDGGRNSGQSIRCILK